MTIAERINDKRHTDRRACCRQIEEFVDNYSTTQLLDSSGSGSSSATGGSFQSGYKEIWMKEL